MPLMLPKLVGVTRLAPGVSTAATSEASFFSASAGLLKSTCADLAASFSTSAWWRMLMWASR
jgi:hypothetical protein